MAAMFGVVAGLQRSSRSFQRFSANSVSAAQMCRAAGLTDYWKMHRLRLWNQLQTTPSLPMCMDRFLRKQYHPIDQ